MTHCTAASMIEHVAPHARAASGRTTPSDALARTGVAAVLRADTAQYLLPVAHTLAASGLVCLELTLTTPGGLDALELLRRDLGPDAGFDVGAGNVRTAAQAHRCIQSGSSFLVSPTWSPEVLAAGRQVGIPVYSGGLTPTELAQAWDGGVSAVKLFPAASVGPTHLRALRETLPELPIMPAGGIQLDQVGAWVRAGAFAVALGDALIGDALSGGSMGALADRARRALSDVARARVDRGSRASRVTACERNGP